MKPELCTRLPGTFEFYRWGPTWERMKVTAIWLAESGMHFRFDDKANCFDKQELGLPKLFLFDFRWDMYEVRVGDYLIKLSHHNVIVVPKQHYHEQFALAANDAA